MKAFSLLFWRCLCWRVLMVAVCFMMISCAGVVHRHPAGEAILYHQQYEPITDWRAFRLFDSALEHAEMWYGWEPVIVDDIVLRQSITKRAPYLMSKADVFDWRRFMATLVNDTRSHTTRRIWHYLKGHTREMIQTALLKHQMLSRQQKLDLIQAINHVIQNQNLYLPHPADAADLSKNMSGPRRNRLIIDRRFASSVSPFRGVARVRLHLNLCENYDAPGRRFAIYLDAVPGDKRFPLLIAHEAFHVLNPHVHDWYAEGLANVFAQRFASARGYDFSPWRDLFARGTNREPYAISYQMMSRIREITGDDRLASLIRYTKPNLGWTRSDLLHIDIDRWLKTLDLPMRQKVMATIDHYGRYLSAHRTGKIGFTLPGLR